MRLGLDEAWEKGFIHVVHHEESSCLPWLRGGGYSRKFGRRRACSWWPWWFYQEKGTALVSARLEAPVKSQFFRPRATGQMAL